MVVIKLPYNQINKTMANEIKGKISHLLPAETGAGKNGNWIKQVIVLAQDGQYPKSVALTVWGDKIPIPKIGAVVTAFIDIESREHQGKWYTDARAFRLDTISNEQKPVVNYKPRSVGKDDLPF